MGYKGLKRVTKQLQGVTEGYEGLQGDSRVRMGYKELQGVTGGMGYRGFQGVTRGTRVRMGCKELQVVTWGYKVLQGVTEG